METILEIRPARPSEWKTLKEIRLQALQDSPESFGERYQDVIQKDDDQWQQDFQKAVESEHQDILFATINSVVVGMLFVFVRDQRKKIGGIGGLWIAPNHRQKGSGRQIIETALAWLKSKGLQTVTFWSNTTNEASTKFYEKLGFSYTGIEKPLESAPNFIIGEMKKEL